MIMIKRRKDYMKVSVIVPVYNVSNYIEKCLLSIKNQSLKDFECLIIFIFIF